eukprot:10060479-Alexandrium_andersonii.AAC.1
MSSVSLLRPLQGVVYPGGAEVWVAEQEGEDEDCEDCCGDPAESTLWHDSMSWTSCSRNRGSTENLPSCDGCAD